MRFNENGRFPWTGKEVGYWGSEVLEINTEGSWMGALSFHEYLAHPASAKHLICWGLKIWILKYIYI